MTGSRPEVCVGCGCWDEGCRGEGPARASTHYPMCLLEFSEGPMVSVLVEEMVEDLDTYEEAQKRLTEYADLSEEMGVYLHRDLKTLPKEYVETVQAYLKEGAHNITYRKLVEDFELKYEKARGDLFDSLHERDTLHEQDATCKKCKEMVEAMGIKLFGCSHCIRQESKA